MKKKNNKGKVKQRKKRKKSNNAKKENKNAEEAAACNNKCVSLSSSVFCLCLCLPCLCLCLLCLCLFRYSFQAEARQASESTAQGILESASPVSMAFKLCRGLCASAGPWKRLLDQQLSLSHSLTLCLFPHLLPARCVCVPYF